MQKISSKCLTPESAGYVVMMALKATGVPGADAFGSYIQNALNWIYTNGGHLGVGANSGLNGQLAQAFMVIPGNLLRLRLEAGCYVVQQALRATNVPGAEAFGSYIQNAITWVYANSGHFGVLENSGLDQFIIRAVMARSQPQAGQTVPVRQQQPVQQPVQAAPVQNAPAQPYVQHQPHAVPVQAPVAQMHPAAQPAPVQQPQQAAPAQEAPQAVTAPVAAQVSGEPESLTSAPVNPASQESLANSDAVLLG